MSGQLHAWLLASVQAGPLPAALLPAALEQARARDSAMAACGLLLTQATPDQVRQLAAAHPDHPRVQAALLARVGARDDVLAAEPSVVQALVGLDAVPDWQLAIVAETALRDVAGADEEQANEAGELLSRLVGHPNIDTGDAGRVLVALDRYANAHREQPQAVRSLQDAVGNAPTAALTELVRQLTYFPLLPDLLGRPLAGEARQILLEPYLPALTGTDPMAANEAARLISRCGNRLPQGIREPVAEALRGGRATAVSVTLTHTLARHLGIEREVDWASWPAVGVLALAARPVLRAAVERALLKATAGGADLRVVEALAEGFSGSLRELIATAVAVAAAAADRSAPVGAAA